MMVIGTAKMYRILLPKFNRMMKLPAKPSTKDKTLIK
jgi:hypothetical protein